MKKVMFYCQHVLGMGHLMRSMALVEGLAQTFQVCFLNGGELVPGFPFPSGVGVVNLPPLITDENFEHIQTTGGQSLAQVQHQRLQQILSTFDRLQPEAVIIELFPFGRKKFSFELLPLLARIRLHAPQTKVVCSLRDILVSRPGDPHYETRVCEILNRYFDLLLIHADPDFQRLDETFGAVAGIASPIHYTGYVAQHRSHASAVAASERTAAEDTINLHGQLPLILASAGGGRVGYELLAAAAEASALLNHTWPHQLLIFTGPYLSDEQFLRLQNRVVDTPHILLRRYTSRFLDYMAKADLSISMAGYNTCMNILVTRTRALVLPFTGGDNNEQTIRAHKLAACGAVTVLQPDELQPERLAARIMQSLQAEPVQPALNLDGVANSAVRLASLLREPAAARITRSTGLAPIRHAQTDSDVLERELRPVLERLQALGRPIEFFLRDDDVDEDEESLRHLLDVALARGVPVNLAVIPDRLTPGGVRLLKTYKKLCPHLFELHQHGWQHINHEQVGRKCEFGSSRSFEQQYDDIARGKSLLEKTFGKAFFPAFTPPWNRCTADTLAALEQLNFKVFSKDRDAEPLTGCAFQEISISVDLLNSKQGGAMRPAGEVVGKLIDQMQQGDLIGMMLHHKVMSAEAFAFLDQLLAELGRYPLVRFSTFRQLHRCQRHGLVAGGVS